eukprot:557050-Pyramimonas_sp.AAC.1
MSRQAMHTNNGRRPARLEVAEVAGHAERPDRRAPPARRARPRAGKPDRAMRLETKFQQQPTLATAGNS